MRVLCAIDLLAGSGAGLVRRVEGLASGMVDELVLVHVIDPGPRHDVERRLSARRLLPHPDPARTEAMAAAEEAAGREALAEAAAAAEAAAVGQDRDVLVQTRLEWGKPEQVLVYLAQELQVDLLVIRAREKTSTGSAGSIGGIGSASSGVLSPPHPQPHPRPEVGPGSIGHTARFVLDHVPCDVLLLRTQSSRADEDGTEGTSRIT